VRPGRWLFPGKRKDRHLDASAVQRASQRICREQGLPRITPHTLRHCFATHLLENGTDIVHIKQLLGHSSISSTLRYTRISKQRVSNIPSPLDSLY